MTTAGGEIRLHARVVARRLGVKVINLIDLPIEIVSTKFQHIVTCRSEE